MNNKKKKLSIIAIISLILLLFAFSTTAYSAISSTVKITGNAYAKIESNIRITNFSINSTSNGVSNYEEFSKNTIQTEVVLQANSYISYNLEITNYGNIDMGILDITGLPENINYEIEDYTLKDKICDDTGKCNNHAKKTYILKLYTTNASFQGIVNLNFDFRPFYKITYVNFNNTYQTEFLAGDHFFIDLSEENPTAVNVTGISISYFNYDNGILEIKNAQSDIEVEAIEAMYTFDYTGDYQTFTAPYSGIYKIELWGAKGNDNYDASTVGAAGGYTSGNIKLTKGQNIYIYVGQKGTAIPNGTPFNNGTADANGWNGGGATDVRLISGTWDSSESINSRIMVAAGGGTGTTSGTIGAAGGLIGYSGGVAQGGTQTSYGQREGNSYKLSAFGMANGGCTSGNGYYGGGGAACANGSGGGSSFISGHNGCVAIASSTSTTPRTSSSGNQCAEGTTDITCSYHYSGLVFTDTVMIDGLGYQWTTAKGNYAGMPTYDGTSTMTGNENNGYAKITLKNINVDYKITYNGITGTYQNSIEKGDDLIVDFSTNAPSKLVVLDDNSEYKDYTYENGVLRINNVSSNLIISTYPYTITMSYTGELQQFIVPVTGTYKIELWGAQGGYAYSTDYLGGLGAYTSGRISLNKNTKLYFAIGNNTTTPNNQSLYNYFGGGSGGESISNGCYGGDGGGATDVRLNDSINSRIMVAAGGGGAGNQPNWGYGYGSAGGGLTSENAIGDDENGKKFVGTSATQTTAGTSLSSAYTSYCMGSFGYGGHACYGLAKGWNNNFTGGGGGGGYFGGGGAGDSTAGSGGSSYISGHNGCVAIQSEANTSPKTNCIDGTTDITCSYHYSGYKFFDTIMIDGNGYKWTTKKTTQTGMPTHDGTSTMTGNVEDGYAKIMLIEAK